MVAVVVTLRRLAGRRLLGRRRPARVLQASSDLSGHAAVHAAEVPPPAGAIVVFLLLLRVPFAAGDRVEFPLAVALPLRVHDAPVGALLAPLCVGDFLAFQEGGLIGFRAGVRGGDFGGVFFGGGDLFGQFFFGEFGLWMFSCGLHRR